LTNKVITVEDAEKYEERFIGGRGVGAWILLQGMKPEVGPLDPESVLVFSTGPLSGTSIVGSCRTAIESKNCLTGGVN